MATHVREMAPFDEIAPSTPLRFPAGDSVGDSIVQVVRDCYCKLHFPAGDINAKYVNELYCELLRPAERMPTEIERDLTRAFSPDQKARMEELQKILRTTWKRLEIAGAAPRKPRHLSVQEVDEEDRRGDELGELLGLSPMPAPAYDAQYVNDLYCELIETVERLAGSIKQTLTEPFPPDQRARIEVLEDILRMTWESLMPHADESQ